MRAKDLSNLSELLSIATPFDIYNLAKYQMKNRKIVEFVLYPRLFHNFSMLYKGTYSLSFQIYHISPSNSQTYAFPFVLPDPQLSNSHKNDKTEKATLHCQQNFSFQTQKFDIIYKDETKHLKTQCIFRLEYEYGKEYSTYLCCKLFKKIKKKKDEQPGYCTPKSLMQNKFQVVGTKIIKINQIQQINTHLRVSFTCSQFFSAVDFRICSFYQGIKLFKSKKQLSTLVDNYDLSKVDPLTILRQKQKRDEKQGKAQYMLIEEPKQLSNEILFCYNEFQKMLSEYSFWRNQIIQFRETALTEYDLEGRKLVPFAFQELNYLNRGDFMKTDDDIKRAYGIDSLYETLAAIFEEKQLVRCNIRALRQYYCILLFHQPLKGFKNKILQNERKQENFREKAFVSFQTKTSDQIRGQIRNRAIQDFKMLTNFCPDKIQRIPYLLFQGYERPKITTSRQLPAQTLTVFVHGYQGSSFDFQKAKNYLKKFNRNTTVLIVESITKVMEKSIEELGKKVANEVIKYIQGSKCDYERINFVGFSLGGLIVRACLSDLGLIRQKLGIFVTFSSPHLGITESQNSLVNLGVWYLTKVAKVKNLKELNLQSDKLHDSLLMKMSKCSHISKFSKVILVGSKDDGFVPLYSTFLERSLCQNEILELCDNLRSRISRLQRVEVLFNTQHAGTLDKLTGRRGHIEFIDNHYFLEFFFRIYGPFF